MKILFDSRSISIVCTIVTFVGLSACDSLSPPNPPTEKTQSATETVNPNSTETSEVVAPQPDADVDYLTTLGLMKGHLMVAKELLVEGKGDQAKPHIVLPAEQLYGDVQDGLAAHNVPGFQDTLTQLYNLVKSAPDDPQILRRYEAAMKAIDTAIEAVPLSQRESPDFMLAVIHQILAMADEEYEKSIADGTIVDAIKYQDSRGFFLYADELYQGIAESVKQQNQTTQQAIEASFTELRTAWPSTNPPETPVMTPEQVSELVEKIAHNAQKN